jgi:hypothetical protein
MEQTPREAEPTQPSEPDPDAEPPLTKEIVEQDEDRDQAEGE